jgi:hypothetical protein
VLKYECENKELDNMSTKKHIEEKYEKNNKKQGRVRKKKEVKT